MAPLEQGVGHKVAVDVAVAVKPAFEGCGAERGDSSGARWVPMVWFEVPLEVPAEPLQLVNAGRYYCIGPLLEGWVGIPAVLFALIAKPIEFLAGRRRPGFEGLAFAAEAASEGPSSPGVLVGLWEPHPSWRARFACLPRVVFGERLSERLAH